MGETVRVRGLRPLSKREIRRLEKDLLREYEQLEKDCETVLHAILPTPLF